MTTVQILLNGVLLGGFYLLMAQGLNLIFGVMHIVNFAHGAFMVVPGLMVYSLWSGLGISPFLALPVVVLVAFAAGVLVQWLILERIKGKGIEHELLTLIATFGLSHVLINLGQAIWGTSIKSVSEVQSLVTIGEIRLASSLLIGFVLAVGFTAALIWWLNGTVTGRSLRAVSQTTVGAEICAINARRVRMLGFGIGAGLAAAAGMLLVISQPIAPQLADRFTIIAFVVVALGGLGNYAGAALGALILGVSQTFTGYELGILAQTAVPYVLLILIMLFRPQGLLPKAAR